MLKTVLTSNEEGTVLYYLFLTLFKVASLSR